MYIYIYPPQSGTGEKISISSYLQVAFELLDRIRKEPFQRLLSAGKIELEKKEVLALCVNLFAYVNNTVGIYPR